MVSHTEFVENRRPRVFCASLADWLDDEVPIEWTADLLDLIRRTQNLDWLLLSKRPQNWMDRVFAAGSFFANNRPNETEAHDFIEGWIQGQPPANVWIGTTVEDQQRADERIPHLLRIPAKVRFLSCEPLIGPVDLGYTCFNGADSFGTMPGIHWAICGGESGPKARPMEEAWARSLKDQCASAGVAFFMKQLGGVRDKRHELEQLPEDLRIREFPTP